ncbi:Glucan 1,3-beta-glucosidase 3 [Hypsizygus marmoreus]|uniref:Glucan 1,3-beta-glucosidase 3 n=1 Tax=Hypsizygus marmoreus TaxID=39966 RepID=A0A369JP92_HYPMA|nr:Glucan 1,3-beta-glucosidase 3 [Hypsizygus marmoreus]
MIFNAASFSALLQALRLTQGSFKPDPTALAPTVTGNNDTNTVTPPPTRPVGAAQSVPSGLNFLEAGDSSAPQPKGCDVEPYDAPPVENQVFAPFDATKANIYRYRQQQSVNLGSWFVQENWMVPSLFKCASGNKLSELDIASGWGSSDSAQSVLERHWDTWIDEKDFEYLASIGINTVRLPIGYWNLGQYYCQGTPFEEVCKVYRNSWSRIVRAINMAANVGIGVLVDLHGAVGSQNGQPHSGISDGATNMFKDPASMDKTINVLMFLMQQLAPVTNIVGIQILNEPKNVPELTDFYTRAITSMRQAPTPMASTFPLYLHNGFDLERFSDYVSQREDFVVQDHHSYFVFTPSDAAEPASDHTHDVQGTIADTLARASDKQRRNIVVDEWSCALTAQSIANEPDKDKARRDFCEGQMDVYTNATAGWSFWSYKKEECEGDPGWCFKAAVNNSLPATFFSYGQAPVTDKWKQQALTASIGNITAPSTSDILARPQANNVNAAASSTRREAPGSSYDSSSHSRHHRFNAVHGHHHRRETYNGEELTDGQRLTVKGYTDGFIAAKAFAMVQNSKLGFVGQYVADSLAQLGPSVVKPGMEQIYRDAFGQGLSDGQGVVMSIINPSPGSWQ